MIIDCGVCKKPIKPDESRMIFQKTENVTVEVFHLCCYQETLLCEVWGALELEIKYQSGCGHVNHTSRFNVVKWLKK